MKVKGANDGIVSTASLILGVAAANTSHQNILLTGIAGLVAGAMSMAVVGQIPQTEHFRNANRYDVEHLPHVLICKAINFIDASALETLTDLQKQIQDAGIQLYLTEVKGPVMDRLVGTDFLEQLGQDRIFLTTQEVYENLKKKNS